MNAEIIAVGSEMLTPQRIDTNSLHITERLNVLGVEVLVKTIVGDDRGRLTETIATALRRSDVIVITGGLGPTEDDLTRDAVAAALGRQMQFHQDICDAIEERFRRGGRPMVEINKRQAYVIDGAEVLPNPNGTAPGQWVEADGRVIMLLPGPPSEMKPMFAAQCYPRLERMLPPQVIRTRVYRIAGMGESDVDQRVAPVYTRYTNPVTTILAALGDVQLHFRARTETVEEAERLLDGVSAQIEPILGDHIYSHSMDPLEVVIGNRLRERGETVCVAESCTGGMVGERITAVAGSSDYFVGGFLVYTDRMKRELLGVSEELLKAHTAVSPEAAEAMAIGARNRTGATWALSVTGVAGPATEHDPAPVGTVFIGLAGPQGCKVHPARYRIIDDRARVRTLATQTALDLLRRSL